MAACIVYLHHSFVFAIPRVCVHITKEWWLVTENCEEHSPILYVQLRVGTTTLPAIVDSGACDNFISEQAVAELHLEVRPLRMATRI